MKSRIPHKRRVRVVRVSLLVSLIAVSAVLTTRIYQGIGHPLEERGSGESVRPVQALSSVELLREVAHGMPGWEDLAVDMREQIARVGGWRIRFGAEGPVVRWREFVRVKEDIVRRGFPSAEVDLRFQGQVIVRFNRGGEGKR